MSWDAWVEGELESIRDAGRLRSLRPLDGCGPRFLLADGSEVVSFSSNDYLGLSQHPRVVDAARQALERWGTGAGSSRLIVGDRIVHRELEEALARWRTSEASLVFATGYQANLAVLTTFGAASRIVSDELNHASIIDGARLSRSEIAVYRHADVEHASHLVKSAPGRAVLVSDTVFSMDGDLAPVGELSELAAASGALLVLDDAHSVFDPPVVDPDAAIVRVGTLSKTLGALGGFVAAPRRWIDLLVNRARSFIFTTALSPADAAASLAAVEVNCSAEGADLRDMLRRHVDVLRPGHPSPILPIVIGDETAAVEASERLLAEGLLVPAIRPPTVPRGTSRLRISLSAAHTMEDLSKLAAALETC